MLAKTALGHAVAVTGAACACAGASAIAAASAAANTVPPATTTTETGADQTLRAVRYCSLALLGGYTAMLCYRVGLLRRILPTHLNTRLEQSVERVKSRTEPVGSIKRFALARGHLLRAYGWAASGMITATAGVVLFCVAPRVPIVIPLAVTAISSMLICGLPKRIMIQPARVACFYAASLAAGYCFGPIGWAAQDTLVVFVMLTGCTMTGLCVSLFITRGMVSYFVSSQVLSLALSLSLVTAPKQSRDLSPFKLLKAQPGVQVILNGDVNVLLTMQLIANVGINLLHTLPTIYSYVSSDKTDAALEEEADPLEEAFCICAGWGYIIYRASRFATSRIICRVLSDNPSNAHRGSEGAWTMTGSPSSSAPSFNRTSNVGIASSLTAAIVTLLWYVKVISLLQKGDAEATLSRVRAVCARASPVGMLLGSHSTYMAPSHR